MKKSISILILLILLFFAFQWGMNYFKEEHEITYQVFLDSEAYEVKEKYQKDYYDVVIQSGENIFYFTFPNEFNKQKKIVEKVEYKVENEKSCMYPVLENEKTSYIQCLENGNRYTSFSYPDSNFVASFLADLTEKGYSVSKTLDLENTKVVGATTIYSNDLLDSDTVTLWNYKGIDIARKQDSTSKNVNSFDIYENKHGILVGKYYVIPEYQNSKLLEFKKLNRIDLESNEIEKIDLGYTLSSSTYVNGVVDGKLYFTDPSNLLQIEVNLEKKNARLIGSVDIGGQIYHGSWENANIYDFQNNQILFTEEVDFSPIQNYSYSSAFESENSYYFYQENGNFYRVIKNHLENPILLFQQSSINNVVLVGDTIYYVSGDTLYYFEKEVGSIPILKNNELRYNTFNRISVYRKS